MIVGFNHNFGYKGQIFHVQTEDGGLKSPNIITLLYKGGTILASKKTSYADITKSDHLEVVVEELMKEQHREMLRRLKNGDFDNLLPEADAPAVTASPAAAAPPTPAAPQATSPPPQPSAPSSAPARQIEASLDEIILSYLTGDDERP
jgi:ribosomal protein L12E/L44/L45/RPP1/RPP2